MRSRGINRGSKISQRGGGNDIQKQKVESRKRSKRNDIHMQSEQGVSTIQPPPPPPPPASKLPQNPPFTRIEINENRFHRFYPK